MPEEQRRGERDKPVVMAWKKELLTDIGDYISAMQAVESAEEALNFFATFAFVTTPHQAAIDVGYLTGYLSDEARDRWFEWLPGLKHPMLGRRTDFTPEELVALGVKWGKEQIEEGKRDAAK